MKSFQMVSRVVLVLALTGCSAEGVKRFAFDTGQQYACQQGNEDRPDESMNDLKCMMDPAGQEGMSYEEYQQARQKESR